MGPSGLDDDGNSNGVGTVCDPLEVPGQPGQPGQPGEPGQLLPARCANAKLGTPAGESLTGTVAGDTLTGLAGTMCS